MIHRHADKAKGLSPTNAVQKALVDLYLSVKFRNGSEESPVEKTEAEESNLLATDPLLLVDYIKSSIDILTNTQVEKALQMAEAKREEENESSTQRENAQNLEELTQSLEAEVRLHIRVLLIKSLTQ